MTPTDAERRARQVVERTTPEDMTSPRGILARELWVVLKHLDRTWRLFDTLEHDLHESIGRIGSEVLQVERLFSRTAPVRADLVGKLLTLQAERRRLALQREQHLRPLFDQLVAILNKYAFVVGDD